MKTEMDKLVIVMCATLATMGTSTTIASRYENVNHEAVKRPLEVLLERTTTSKEIDQSILGTKPMLEIVRDLLMGNVKLHNAGNGNKVKSFPMTRSDDMSSLIMNNALEPQLGYRRRRSPINTSNSGMKPGKGSMKTDFLSSTSSVTTPFVNQQKQQSIPSFAPRHHVHHHSQHVSLPLTHPSDPFYESQVEESSHPQVHLTEYEEAMLENILEHVARDDPKPLFDFLGINPDELRSQSSPSPSSESGENPSAKSRNSRNRATNDATTSLQALLELYKLSMKKTKREGPQLSVVSPLDVLRQQLIYELARRRLKESQDQIQVNSDLLKSLGRRRRSADDGGRIVKKNSE